MTSHPNLGFTPVPAAQPIIHLPPNIRTFLQQAFISGCSSISNERDPPPTASRLIPAPSTMTRQPGYRVPASHRISFRKSSCRFGETCRVSPSSTSRSEAPPGDAPRGETGPVYYVSRLAPLIRTSSLSHTPRAIHVGTRTQ